MAQACVLLLIGAEAAAQRTPAPDTKPASLDTVVVTGIRRGIEDAIDTKRNSSSIVEAISSEDIGKLPDVTVAESLSRLSGVATQRSKVNGKATGVSVRGMSPSFNGSLLNGREQASTSDARSPEFDLFPAELTSSLLVYKTPDASLVGQGLASTIDMRTIRPLDHGKRTLVLNARKERIGVDSGVEVGGGHRGSVIYVDQFYDRKIGLALGLTSLREDNGGEHRFDSWGGYVAQMDYNGAQVNVPGGFKYETQRRKSTRDGATATLQFKPSAEFKATADLFYARGTEQTKQTGLEGAIAFGAGIYDPNGSLINATVANGVATSGTATNYKGVVRNHMFSNKDSLRSIGVNTEWKASEAWRFEADVSHSRGQKDISNFETTAGQPGDVPAAQLGTISWTGFNGSNFADVKYKTSLNYADRNVALLTDVDGWGGGTATPQAGYAALPTITDKVSAVRLTAHQDFEWGPLVGAHYGINLNKRDKARLGDEGRLSILNAGGYGSAKIPGSETAMAGASGIEVASWDPTGSLGSIYALNRWVDATVLSRNWTVQEKVATAYAMADLAGKIGSVPYTGNIGLQLVNTEQNATGNRVDLAKCTGITVETCPYVVNADGTRYTHVLPSLNLTFELGNQQLLRVGAGKQVARANLDNMKASMDFGVQNATALQPALTGFAGNPKLKPYEALALDLSYEKYFDKHGYISVAAFYKKLNSYVLNVPRPFDFKPFTSPTTPLPTTGPFAGSTVGFLTQPVNGEGGNLHGFELSINLPFRMAASWLDGFGGTLTHSHTASSVRLPTAGFVSPQNGPVFRDVVTEIGLPGLSKDVSTLRFYYEKHGFQLAWAAHKRSNFIGQILDYRSDTQYTFIKGETIVGAQVGYEFQQGMLKGLSVLFQGHNLTNTPFQEYTVDPNIVTNRVVYGKTYRLGLNYKY